MVKWKNIVQSRCAIDSCYDWMDEKLTDGKLIDTLRKLNLQEESDQINKYLYKYRHYLLIDNMKRAFRRHKV